VVEPAGRQYQQQGDQRTRASHVVHVLSAGYDYDARPGRSVVGREQLGGGADLSEAGASVLAWRILAARGG
jgi:hypothetical protein